MEYQTVYAYSMASAAPRLLIPVFFIFIGSCVVVGGKYASRVGVESAHKIRLAVLLGWGFCIVGGLLTTQALAEHLPAIWASLSKEFTVVEGRVHVESTQPPGGHAPGDIVSIDGHQFEVNYFDLGPGYQKTIAHGGALREGAAVRLLVHGDIILQIDLLSNPDRPGLQAAGRPPHRQARP